MLHTYAFVMRHQLKSPKPCEGGARPARRKAGARFTRAGSGLTDRKKSARRPILAWWCLRSRASPALALARSPSFYLLTRVALPTDSPRAQTMMTNTADESAVLQIGSTELAAFDANNRALENMAEIFQTNLSQGVIDPNMLASSEDTIKEGVQQQQQLRNAMVHMHSLYKNKTASLAAAKDAISEIIVAAQESAAQDAAAKAAADEENMKFARSILAAGPRLTRSIRRVLEEYQVSRPS